MSIQPEADSEDLARPGAQRKGRVRPVKVIQDDADVDIPGYGLTLRNKWH